MLIITVHTLSLSTRIDSCVWMQGPKVPKVEIDYLKLRELCSRHLPAKVEQQTLPSTGQVLGGTM